MRPLLFPEHPQYWFETLRVLGHTAYGGADIGETLTAVVDLPGDDPDAWYSSWAATADRVAEESEQARRAGRLISARDGLLRASTYYRTADFFLHADPSDPRIAHAFGRGVECFASAAELFVEPTITPVRIPFEGTALHGWFYRCAGSGPRPTIVMHNGFDGGAEEMHFLGALGAAERGFHVLTFDGPGQPSAAHEGLWFRPDWENVVGPILDHLLDHGSGEVDPARIGLLGVSLGGYLAPRAAAFDDRIAAVVCNDGVYEAFSPALSSLGTTRDELEQRWHDPAFEAELARVAAASSSLRWALDHGRWVMNCASNAEFVRAYSEYNLRGGLAERITCPVLVAEAADDLFYAGSDDHVSEPRRLYEALRCPKTLMTFTDAEGAGAHCHLGAQRLAVARMIDWFGQHLGDGRPETAATGPGESRPAVARD